MHDFDYRSDELHAEDVPLSELAARHGTPLFVYSHATLVRHVRRLHAAFAGPGGDAPHLVAYSVKANPSLAVIRTLANEGAGADVVSGGELARALAAGVPGEKIVFAGVGKRPDELAAAVDAGVLSVNVEVPGELDELSRLAHARGRTVGVSLRVNPDVQGGAHRYIQAGTKVTKFGIPIEEALALYRRAARLPGIEVRGVACHIGSQILDLEPLQRALGQVRRLFQELWADGIPLRHVDVGGGLGVRYRDEVPPSVEDYAAAVLGQVGDLGATIVLEPGRMIVANAGILLTRVLYRKEVAGKTFLIVDQAMNDLTRPALYGGYHEVVAVRRGGPAIQADVVGPICETGDFLLEGGQVPDARPGDLLAVMSAGAYGRSMSSNYNTRPRAAEVLVHGSEAHLVQERETIEELLARERIPAFLNPSILR